MRINDAFALESMTPCYTRPSEEQACRLISDLERAENYGFISFSFRDVIRNERVPWKINEHIIDANIEVSNLGEKFLFSCYGKNPSVSGSGVNENRIFGSVHASSEAMERLAARFEGQTDLRPSPHSAWSTKKKYWIDIRDYPDTFRDLSTHRSGEAFHIIPGEATRAALCELIEKDTIHKLLTRKSEFCIQKVTKQACRISQNAHNATHSLAKIGYQVEFFHIIAFEGIHVILAVSRNHSVAAFRNCFKGAGADFSLFHAIEQATSELGRSHFMGKPTTFHTPADAAHAISIGELTPASVDIALLLFPENRGLFSHIFEIPEEECADKKIDTRIVLENIASQTEDILIVPLADSLYGISGFATKILIPGYSNIPQISNMVDVDQHKLTPSWCRA